MSIQDIGDRITWLEAVYLIAVLTRDPSSWTQAARGGWDYPVSREWIVGIHTYDLLAAVNSKKKPTGYPTPWPSADSKRIGSKKRQSRQQVLDYLARMNPKENRGP